MFKKNIFLIIIICRHYYICVESTSSSSPVAGVRHGCGRGRVFEEQSETCQSSDEDCVEVKLMVQNETEKPVKKSDDKQGLFVEFIQFLMKIGMFNKNVVQSLLSNKEIFL